MPNLLKNIFFSEPILPWEKKQNIEILFLEDKGCKIIKNQSDSTPGIIQRCKLKKNTDYYFAVEIKTETTTCYLWIGDVKKKTIAIAEINALYKGMAAINFSINDNDDVFVGILHDKSSLQGAYFTLFNAVLHIDGEKSSPYKGLPNIAFWKTAVAEKHFFDLECLSENIDVNKKRVGTAGSCFAQHISREVKKCDADFIDLEPCPPFIPDKDAAAYGYGLYSCRYGNIYTVAQLYQLFQESLGYRIPEELVWCQKGRFYDALRPSVTPYGCSSEEDVLIMRKYHLNKVRKLWYNIDIFIFTLGLTEAWISLKDGTAFPTAPGTIAGAYNKNDYIFHNYNYTEIYNDLKLFWDKLREINPSIKLLLTVSPVPLTATASGKHVLIANTYSKSVLRAVAGDFETQNDNVYYFPSYEIISTAPSRSMCFNPDMRTVNKKGVEYVMSHFNKKDRDNNYEKRIVTCDNKKQCNAQKVKDKDLELICDEEELEQFID